MTSILSPCHRRVAWFRRNLIHPRCNGDNLPLGRCISVRIVREFMLQKHISPKESTLLYLPQDQGTIDAQPATTPSVAIPNKPYKPARLSAGDVVIIAYAPSHREMRYRSHLSVSQVRHTSRMNVITPYRPGDCDLQLGEGVPGTTFRPGIGFYMCLSISWAGSIEIYQTSPLLTGWVP